MVESKALLNRTTALVSAFALAFAAAIPVVLNSRANALIQSRSITVSTSRAGATGVTYAVRFKAGADMNIKGMIVDFCDESPIIGNGTCTAPAGFTIGAPTVGNYQNMAGWTAVSGNAGRTLALTKAGGEALTVTGTPTYGFDITSVTNPDLGNHTYYARILLYANDTGADSPGAATAGGYLNTATPTVGSYLDAGGIALSTANQLQITSKVQERLTFCLYTDASCSTSGADQEKDSSGVYRTNAITLGDNNGVLDISQPFVDKNTKFDIATNAASGATVVLKGDTLKTGSFDVAAIGAAAAGSTAGAEQFGLCLYESAGTGFDISSVGTGNGNDTYNSANCNSTTQTAGAAGLGVGVNNGGAGTANFGFNSSAVNGTMSASGDTLGKKAAGLSSTATLAFIGNVAPTTEAGIYQTTLTFIATGTY